MLYLYQCLYSTLVKRVKLNIQSAKRPRWRAINTGDFSSPFIEVNIVCYAAIFKVISVKQSQTLFLLKYVTAKELGYKIYMKIKIQQNQPAMRAS